MKKIIDDHVFKAAIKEKLALWVREQIKNQPLALPVIDIKEISEYPLYRLVMRTEVQTRNITKFKRAGALPSRSTQGAPASAEIDVWAVEADTINDFIQDKKSVEIESSIESAPCKKCNGTGQLMCPSCQGQKTVYCLTCHGDGKLVCPKCRRTLKITCTVCEGRGKVLTADKQGYEACQKCEGKGSFPCKDCEKGYNPCKDCGGSGRIPCQACGQTGGQKCPSCSGQGNFISGSCVEIKSMPVEERLAIPNTDIPEKIINEELPSASYTFKTVVDIDDRTDASEAPGGLMQQIESLKKRIAVPPDGKIIKNEVSVEKRFFYNMKYKAGGKESSAWFLITGEKIVMEKSFLNQVYSDLLADLNKKIKSGDIEAAKSIIAKMENIPALKAEVENIKKELTSGLRAPYLTGGAIGAVLALAGVICFERWAWRASFNLTTLIILSAAGVIITSALAVALLNNIKLEFVKTNIQKIAAGIILPFMIPAFVFCAGMILRFNPAKHLDARQMRQEYSAYFPFGLRTLASKEDIEFLRKLVKKYMPCGIDLSAVQKDLKWLSDKLKTDDAAMQKIEKTEKAIENVSENRIKRGKKTFRPRRAREYIK